MNIVFINNMLKNGGAEVSLCRIANLLCAKGHQVHVITLSQEKNPTALLDKRIDYDYIISDSRSNSRVKRFVLRGLNFIKKPLRIQIMTHKLNRCKADIGITFYEFEKCLIPLVRCNAGKKICWFRHDVTDYYICQRIMETEREKFYSLFEKTDRLLFVTHSSMNNFCACFPAFREKSHYFINSIDVASIVKLSETEAVKKDKNKLIFLCLARLAREKGQDLLIEAARRLDRTEYKNKYEIWLIGGYSHHDFEINQTDIMNTSVKCLGYKDNPYPYLKAADVVVVSSRSEGCPNVILEAMALGKPIISTKTSGGMELLEQGKHGLLCDISADALVRAMTTMFEKSEYEHYHKTSEEEGKKHTNEVFADSLVNYLEELIKE